MMNNSSLSLASLRSVEEDANMNLSDTCCTLFSLSWRVLLTSTTFQRTHPSHSRVYLSSSSVGTVPTQVASLPFSCPLPASLNAAQCGLSHQVLPFIVSSLQLELLLLTVGKFDSVAFFIAFLVIWLSPDCSASWEVSGSKTVLSTGQKRR